MGGCPPACAVCRESVCRISTSVPASLLNPSAANSAAISDVDPRGSSCGPGLLTAPTTVTVRVRHCFIVSVMQGVRKTPRATLSALIACSARSTSSPPTPTLPTKGIMMVPSSATRTGVVVVVSFA